VHAQYRAYLLPVGRHSSQSGFGLTAKNGLNPRHVSAFIGKARTMADAIDHLSAWAKEIVRHNLIALGSINDQNVISYCDAAAHKLNKAIAFDGLCKHFGIGDTRVITIAHRTSDHP
jgi:hypothetical protein